MQICRRTEKGQKKKGQKSGKNGRKKNGRRRGRERKEERRKQDKKQSKKREKNADEKEKRKREKGRVRKSVEIGGRSNRKSQCRKNVRPRICGGAERFRNKFFSGGQISGGVKDGGRDTGGGRRRRSAPQKRLCGKNCPEKPRRKNCADKPRKGLRFRRAEIPRSDSGSCFPHNTKMRRRSVPGEDRRVRRQN